MTSREMLEQTWEQHFADYLTTFENHNDASHDLGYLQRVYQTSKAIAKSETASVDPLVLLAAAYFHDLVSLPKNHPDNHMSSRYAAIKAKQILEQMNFPQEKIAPTCHAIETHSFSASLEPQTIEAKILQDADRMEALGALGIMRLFYVSGRLGRAPFDPDDLYAKRRSLDDQAFGFDHFYVKLFKIPDQLQTIAGRHLADKRTSFLLYFIKELELNIKAGFGGALTLVSSCHQAGRLGLQLFNPLGHNAAFDQLLASRKQFPLFIDRFLLQLQEETGL